MNEIKKTKEQLAEDFRTAVHEWGHYEAFAHFGINAIPKVLDEMERYPLCDGQMAVGHCAPEKVRSETTKFQESVIGWAGYMAELIVGVQNPERDIGLPLNAKFLKDCYRAAMCRLDTLSRGDQISICSYKSTWATFKRCYHILRRKKAKLARHASMMTGATPEIKSVPMPEKFPATFADFLRLIVGTDNPEEKFRAFVVSQTEKFFAEKQFALMPEQQRQAMESWTTARLVKYQAGFDKVESWRGAALAYRDWKKRIQTP